MEKKKKKESVILSMRIKFIDNSFYDRKILCRYLNEKKEGNSVYYTVSKCQTWQGIRFKKLLAQKEKITASNSSD